MKDFLIASHILGGISGVNLSRKMTDSEMERTVGEVMRVTREIKRQVAEGAGRLMVAHVMGGTSGIDTSVSLDDQEIEAMVGVAKRVLTEIERQSGFVSC